MLAYFSLPCKIPKIVELEAVPQTIDPQHPIPMWPLRVPAMAATGLAAQSILRRVVPSIPYTRLATHVVRDFFSDRTLILQTSSASGICSLPQAIKGDADVLLKGVGDKSTIEDVKRIVELAKRASLRREVLHTDFLTPPVLKESMLVLQRLADLKIVAQGGYPKAERCRLSVAHPEALTSDPDNVSALSISGNFSFQPCSHGDFLGAILGTGIARNKLGDILLQGEKGAHVLVVPELSDFLVSALDKVGNVCVSCKKIPLLALEYEPPRTKSLKSIEASLRLDAVASAGFKVSRTKMASLISNGDVRVNWSTVTKSNTTIKTGDMISISGEGRLKIGEISSTRKGKFAVELIRYL